MIKKVYIKEEPILKVIFFAMPGRQNDFIYHTSNINGTFLRPHIAKKDYCKVTSSNMSHLEAHAGFFRLLMKGIFDAVSFWQKK